MSEVKNRRPGSTQKPTSGAAEIQNKARDGKLGLGQSTL